MKLTNGKCIIIPLYHFYYQKIDSSTPQTYIDFLFLYPIYILVLLQQFTAFKPLAHRPKPMLAKP